MKSNCIENCVETVVSLGKRTVICTILAGAFGVVATMTNEAHAGGIGLYTLGGVHQGKAYYYRSDNLQGIDSQTRPQLGSGIELMLGDKDDRLIGQMRLGWNYDWQVKDPTIQVTNDANGQPYTYLHPDYNSVSPRNDGVISVGLQWGIWGEPTAFQVVGVTSFSSAFWTVDNLEYFMPEAGAGVTYTLQDKYQLHATTTFAPRLRKDLVMGNNTYVGIRYLFD